MNRYFPPKRSVKLAFVLRATTGLPAGMEYLRGRRRRQYEYSTAPSDPGRTGIIPS